MCSTKNQNKIPILRNTYFNVSVLIYLLTWFDLFLSRFHTQRGAWTHDPEVKTRMLYALPTEPARRPWKHGFIQQISVATLYERTRQMSFTVIYVLKIILHTYVLYVYSI